MPRLRLNSVFSVESPVIENKTTNEQSARSICLKVFDLNLKKQIEGRSQKKGLEEEKKLTIARFSSSKAAVVFHQMSGSPLDVKSQQLIFTRLFSLLSQEMRRMNQANRKRLEGTKKKVQRAKERSKPIIDMAISGQRLG